MDTGGVGDRLWDGPGKSFGILVDKYRERRIAVIARHRVIWDTSGMVVAKCLGILIEGYRGG